MWDRQRRLEDFLGRPLPFTYAHKPDPRNQMTLARHLAIRKGLGMPTGPASHDVADILPINAHIPVDVMTGAAITGRAAQGRPADPGDPG